MTLVRSVIGAFVAALLAGAAGADALRVAGTCPKDTVACLDMHMHWDLARTDKPPFKADGFLSVRGRLGEGEVQAYQLALSGTALRGLDLGGAAYLGRSKDGRPIIVTDAAINILPSLEDKRDICQNAIELAHALGVTQPKVAILSAVETVTPKIPSTIEAAALCKMADRGQIRGGLVDGPLAIDNAIDLEAAATKGIVSPVAGQADILVAPNLESANMLAKQLTFMADAEAAGIVIGARVPIVLTSRADSARARLASCALAVLFAAALLKGAALLKAAE